MTQIAPVGGFCFCSPPNLVFLAASNLVLGVAPSLIKVLAIIIFLVLMMLEGTKGPNSYGADPNDADQRAGR